MASDKPTSISSLGTLGTLGTPIWRSRYEDRTEPRGDAEYQECEFFNPLFNDPWDDE